MEGSLLDKLLKRENLDRLLMQKEKKGAELVNPYTDAECKGDQVERMFDSIAPAYDFMNTAMTFGLHRYWRNVALKEAARGFKPDAELSILDIATGTGDIAFRLCKGYPKARVVGLDLSEGMLRVAREKCAKLPAEQRQRLEFVQGDSLNMSFKSNSFDLITVAYGVRNFENLAQGLEEMYRVLRPGGKLCVIELSVPTAPVTRALYNLYSNHLIPMVGRLVSGDSRAYKYLPESIAAAPQRNYMTAVMERAGFERSHWHSLTFGTLTYYIAYK